MDKIDNYNHTITLVERKSIVISGVKKIENFDDEEFLIESTMGYIIVKGNGLELLNILYTSFWFIICRV